MKKSENRQQFTISEVRAQLSALLKRVRAGEEIYIAHGHEAIAKLFPFQPILQPRQAGSAKGQFVMSDDFDAALPESFLGSSSKRS